MKKISRIFNITVALFFAAIVSSRCFAQSPSESASKANNSVNRYMDLMTGVFDFVQRNYVDEVDPEILYKDNPKLCGPVTTSLIAFSLEL